MAAAYEQACSVCNLRTGKHQCLQCNEQYGDVSDLIAHQKKCSHFGGHFILPRPSSRVRRLPARFRDISEEIALDEAVGAHAIDYNANEGDTSLSPQDDPSDRNESSEEPVLLPDFPATFYQRKRGDRNEASERDVTEVHKNPCNDVNPSSPIWVQNLDTSGLTFDAAFEKYWCACGKTPKSGWNAGMSSGNIRKHRRSRKCLFDERQNRIDESPKPKLLTQVHFRKLMSNAIVSCNVPFSVVENKEFQALLLNGKGRNHLKLPSRRTIVRDIEAVKNSVSAMLVKCLTTASSKLSITFYLWTDCNSRGFLAVTGHFFDHDLQLRAPLLGISHLAKRQEGHTALRINEGVREILLSCLGESWKKVLQCCATDGAANVTSASRMLSTSRRCLRHNIQLFIKYFCSGSNKIASSLACCNYLARTTKSSSKLREAIGNIPVGVVTRWNSYLMSAIAVYKVRCNLNEYVDSTRCVRDMAAMLHPRLDYLNNGGFRVLHDVSVLLKPLADITIDEEAELYITSSTVIPRLIAAKRHMDTLINNALKADSSNKTILDVRTVGSWKEAR